MKHQPLFYWIFFVFLVYSCQKPGGDNVISYNQHIRPIFNEKCLRCHGGVRKMGGFSLLFEAEAFQKLESGNVALVKGNKHKSALYQRITHQDPELRMPYHAAPLSEEEIHLIGKWIDQGAHFETHWAYIPPDPNLKPPKTTNWGNNEIDAFIAQKLEKHHLYPAEPASKVDLLRRLFLDVTGLPPTPEEADDFLNDNSPKALEKLIDRLLNSPHFGERWAAMWLDLARYADTKGYEKDSNRNIWKFRDYVIQSFNEDKPFDQFTIEQLAGDLLEKPTETSLIATAFHRNAVSNDEGGTDDEQFRIASVIERVSTTYEVWQSTTMACVQCHSHPYDPFQHEDFYKSMYFFNNAADKDIYSEQPKLYTYLPENETKVKEIIHWMTTQLKEEIKLPENEPLFDQKQALLHQLGYNMVEAEDYNQSSALIELIWPELDLVWQVQDSSWIMFEEVDLTDIQAISFRAASPLKLAGRITIHLDALNGPKIGETSVTRTADWPGWQWSKPNEEKLFKNFTAAILPTSGKHNIYYRFWIGDTFIQHLFYLDKIYYHEKSPLKDRYNNQFNQKLVELATIPTQTTPIIQELPPHKDRKTQLLERGNWLTPGKEVTGGLPEIFAQQLGSNPTDRLAFAQWIASDKNPLTARVIVNRIWEQLFGLGIVESMEEFGSQGFSPSHQALLDWLALRLVKDHQWQLKPLIKDMLMSATYQQSSTTTPEKLEKDPRNQLLSRGPRMRLSAEQIRDQVLAVSGLLDRKIGGPSVILPELNIGPGNIPSWAVVQNPGDCLESCYRRTLYTFWKRTEPFPNMTTFDSPDRIICESQRIRTNTPLQALNLLNDTVYYKAARALALRMSTESTLEAQLSKGYQLILFEKPSSQKLALLKNLYMEAKDYLAQPKPTLTNMSNSQSAKVNNHEMEALTLVANALLNLDEFIVK